MSVLKPWVSFVFIRGTFDVPQLLGLRTIRAMRVPQCTSVATRGAQRLVCLVATQLTAWSGRICQGLVQSSHAAHSTKSCEFVPRRPSQQSLTRRAHSHADSKSSRILLCALFSTRATRSSRYRFTSRLHCDAHYTPGRVAPQSLPEPPQHLRHIANNYC